MVPKTPLPVEFDSADLRVSLVEGASNFGLSLAGMQVTQLLDYLQLLHKWNASYNLSAIRDPREMLHKHLLDSLSLAPFLQEKQGEFASRIIDVGSGAGLPGIPLAIVFSNRNFTLLDAAGKKARFLFQVRQLLRLPNVDIQNCRVENFLPTKRFDLVLSRAFAPLDKMLKVCKHLLRKNGEYWAMKGVFPQDELSMMEKHYNVDHRALTVPGDIGERCLLMIKPQQL